MKNTITSYQELTEHRGLLFLAMLYVIITVVPTLFLYRLVQVGPLVLPGGMFIFPLIYVLGDVIAEVYGYKVARMVIWYSLICNFIFASAILSVIYLPYPPGYEHVAQKYTFVFKNILRGDVANIFGVLLGRFLNAYILTRWKVFVRGKFFIVRSFTSSAVGELIMLVIWVTIAFSGQLTKDQLLHLALSDYLIRVLYLLIFALPAAGIARFLKFLDGVDIYDKNTNFNPFQLSLKD
jgi:queuosine precursor transporter